MIPLTEDRRMLGYGLLSTYPGIFHFVTTRQGGYSSESYASFNCSPYSGDDMHRVEENQALLCSSFPQSYQGLVIPFQTHGTEIRLIDSVYADASEKGRIQLLNGVDALITASPGYCLCVSTADCIPVLLYDTRNHVVAAVHAGWRGTVNGIVSKTLEMMGNTFHTAGKDVIACIGPGISLQNFEVGNEVYEAFYQAGFDMPGISLKHPITTKWHLDLCKANRLQLLHAGLLPTNIEVSDICTYQNHRQFFSARRLGIRSGRILSGIMLE